MSGRRKHSRVIFWNSPGVLRISRDVVITGVAGETLVAISLEPGVLGEELRVAFSAKDADDTGNVRVAASRPVLVDGRVKYELRPERVGSAAADGSHGGDRVETGD